ncbi:Putative uncharacterized protein [Moritella viscosa]|uniref:Uncharacterized protein n=1 Tax=Moritella viscosa TaxID=80854 RepID=A0A1K9ZZT8_9GAMM|nr:CsiV family protein [Moritella viscosa]SGZ05277.1 Putative uncharacterized protein [Moritella viscosa]SGZ12330.1 Putative uncharacterized protein [Moritella viscosa]SHO12789.1 Putative uncharacterized protein [Moritella viscosa]SHO12791.1 Putative uncharacterized protein [Moritella viscosa]SHO14023.1 Putative uncharacterized protein [Moritella viscosa]
MKKSLISLLVGLSVSSSFAVSAAEEERWFEVEVILFERNVNPAKVIEHWDQAVYPTYSKKNKDPMSLFINNDNLLTPNGDDNTNAHAFANDTITTGLQPTLIDDSDTLPIYGEDDSLQAVTKTDINSDIIKSTHVVIDGANLKDNAKDPTLQIVPANELQLNQQFSALNDHANYNVVLHSAWRMQPKTRHDAIPIRLFAGQNYQQQYQLNGDVIIKKAAQTESPQIATAMTSNASSMTNESNVIDLDNAATIDDGVIVQASDVASISEPTAAVWKIDGELTIYLEHYLYAKTNLFVRKEGTKVIPATQIDGVVTAKDAVTTNAENIDLLKLLGIHLEPKQAEHNEIALADKQVKLNAKAKYLKVGEATENDAQLNESVNNAQLNDKTVPFLNSYPMQQLRVIRSGEIHYLDHPMFGMLIQIRKYEPPVPKEIEATQ